MGSTTQDDSDDEEGDGNDGDASTPSRRPPGRPTLSPEGRMEFEQLKERRRFLTNKYYGQRQEEEKRERLSEKRRAARAQQWENKHDSTKKKFSGSRGWAGHKLTFYRLLPVEESDQEEILARLIGSFPTCGLTSCDTQMHVNHSTTMYRKFTEVNDFLSEKCSDEIANMLLLHWGKNLAEHDFMSFLARGLHFVSDDDIPLRCTAQIQAERIKESMFNNNHKEDMRRLNHQYGITVYKEIKNRHKQGGVIEILAKVLPSTRYFASRIVKMVDEGREEELLRREKRRDSVPRSVVEELVEFLCQASISRSVPGRDVSVSYGKREPLHLLRHSKEAIIEMFKRTQPHNYSVRKLLMCFPKNFRIPRDNDRSRNACPQHDSYPRWNKYIN